MRRLITHRNLTDCQCGADQFRMGVVEVIHAASCWFFRAVLD